MNDPYQHPIFLELDLAPIMELAMTSEAGPRWSKEDALVAADLYRTFLWLCWAYPDQSIVPNTIVDQFWHLHILDTKRYAADCERIFGKMLHHNPYLGLRHDEDKLRLAFERTIELVARHFPELVS